METQTRLVTIAGFARNGKDTMFNILNHCLNTQYSTRSNNIKLADSLRRMVQEECIEKHGINAWTEHPDEKAIIRDILINRAIAERAKNPEVFCEHLFDFGGLKPNVLNVLTDLRYVNELDFIEQRIPCENRFHIWVSRGDKFGPVGPEEEKFTTKLYTEHIKKTNAVVYDWKVDMEGAGWSVWDKKIRKETEADIITRIVKPMLYHFGLEKPLTKEVEVL